MHGGDLLPPVPVRVVERKLGDARGGDARDDLERLDDPGDDLVLEARVLALGVLANRDEVDPVVARLGVVGGKWRGR